MSDQTWQNLVSEDNLVNIKQIYFNGSYGDFACHPNSISFLSQIKNKDIEIVIATNGSTRNLEYWKDLALVLKEFKNHSVIFALDGASQEVHASHRINTNFQRILQNANAFISAGGNASWQFVTFKENIHEIEQAYNLSIEYKFKEFLVINSYEQVIGNLHALPTSDYLLYLKKYRYSSINLTPTGAGTITACPWTKLSRVQVNVDGSIWPCCWTAEINLNRLGVDFNTMPTVDKYSIREIIESDYYQKFITDQLYNEESYCYKQCPAKFNDIKFIYNGAPKRIRTSNI